MKKPHNTAPKYHLYISSHNILKEMSTFLDNMIRSATSPRNHKVINFFRQHSRWINTEKA